MGENVIHFKRIVRGFENRNKNFMPDKEIVLDDNGLVHQSGVDEDGIPIIYIEHTLSKLLKAPSDPRSQNR